MTDATGSATDGGEVVEVVDVPALQHFEMHVDGQLAGVAEYRARPGDDRFFRHTEVATGYQGRGLSQRLIRAALDETRAAHLSVLPHCPAVRSFIARHPDYLDLVPPGRRAEFELS